ncbi:hypothetical protein C3450_25090 [Escherichia coli]|nr:hypothetical protein C3450_25090 [Escherichia coli]
MFLSMEKTFMKTTNESNAMNQHHEPQAQSAGSDACRAEVAVGFPEQVGGRLIVGDSCTPRLIKRIGSKVSVWFDNKEVLSVMYKEDYDPKTTFSDYEARAEEYALSVFAAMRAHNGQQKEKRLCSEARYTIKINSSDNSIAGC